MINHWLDREWVAKVMLSPSTLRNLPSPIWYISGHYKNELALYFYLWKINDPFMYLREPHYYLHKDGIWRQATCNEEGEWTGYYFTEAEAEQTLNSTTNKPERLK